MKFAFVVPTNNPQAFMTGFLSQIHNLSDFLDEFDVSVQVHYQEPWTDFGAVWCDDYLRDWFSEVTSTLTPASEWERDGGGVPIADIRHRAFTLNPDVDVYIVADDDMKFMPERSHPWNSGQFYARVARYMADNPRCGVFMCRSSAGGAMKGLDDIEKTFRDKWATSRGLFVRNIDRTFPGIPQWALGTVGTLEETAMVYHAFSQGYYGARLYNCPTSHPNVRWVTSGEQSMLHNAGVVYSPSGIGARIRERWHDPDWDYQLGSLPFQLINEYRRAARVLDPVMGHLVDMDRRGNVSW